MDPTDSTRRRRRWRMLNDEKMKIEQLHAGCGMRQRMSLISPSFFSRQILSCTFHFAPRVYQRTFADTQIESRGEHRSSLTTKVSPSSSPSSSPRHLFTITGPISHCTIAYSCHSSISQLSRVNWSINHRSGHSWPWVQ